MNSSKLHKRNKLELSWGTPLSLADDDVKLRGTLLQYHYKVGFTLRELKKNLIFKVL